MRRASLLLLALLVPAAAAPAAAPTRQLTLKTGDAQDVTFPADTDLAVSRRGVVDLLHLGDGRWRLTGLHAGFVVIDGRDPRTGATRPPRLFVDVRGARDASPDAAEAAEPALPPWLCEPQGIHCDVAAGIITGTAPSYLWLQRARAACERPPGCIVAAGLPPAALAGWLETLRGALGPDFTVAAGPTGLPSLTAFCGKSGRQRREDEADAATAQAVTGGLVSFRCREELGLRYRLHAKVDLVEQSAIRDLGFEGLAVIQLGVAAPGQPRPRQDAHLLSRLHALEQDRRAVIVGEPVVRLIPNVESDVVSGGEFQTTEQIVHVAHGAETEEIATWKQFGLSLHLTAEPRDEETARVTYDMTFRARSQTGEQVNDQELAVSQLRTAVEVPLGEPVMAGVLDLTTNGTEGGGVPLLSQLPLVGPLFARTATHRSTSRLLFWLELDVEDEDGAAGALLVAPQNDSPSR